MSSDPGAAFAASARRFVELLDRARGSERERILELRPLLATLYAQALALRPPDGVEGLELSEEIDPRELRRRIGAQFPSLGFYWTVLDPLVFSDESPSVGTGDAIDDLLDIHGDLREGLVYWDAGHPRDAVFQWTCMFESHWGEHVLGLIGALHAWCNPEDPGG